jgi:hypothetical protein
VADAEQSETTLTVVAAATSHSNAPQVLPRIRSYLTSAGYVDLSVTSVTTHKHLGRHLASQICRTNH